MTGESHVNFNPATQDWTIALTEALPAITTPVNIDGFSQANVGIPYTYPDETRTDRDHLDAEHQSGDRRQQRPGPGDRRRQRHRAARPGFVLDASDSMIRGLIIDGFGSGRRHPERRRRRRRDPGEFHRGVSALSGRPEHGHAAAVSRRGRARDSAGNSQQGVILNGQTRRSGGRSPGRQRHRGERGGGRLAPAGSVGSQVLGNQIGVIGPSDAGVYWSVGNGAEGVLVQSSSDLIGVVGAGNLISENAGDGVQLDQGATQVQIAGNYIGVAPGAASCSAIRRPATMATASTSSAPRTTRSAAPRPPRATRSRPTLATASRSPARRRPATSSRTT